MKITKVLVFVSALFAVLSGTAAYQYNVKGNQGYITFDSTTTLAFDLTLESRKDKDNGQDNYIDRGEGMSDYGWYNLDTGASGSFKNGLSATFSENDRIGLWVKDNTGDIYTSTKPDESAPDNVIWGKSREINGGFSVGGGNFGSNGTQEYYTFKVNTANINNNTPSGQPLPGIIATLLVAGGTCLYLKKRKKLYGNEKH